MAHPLPVDAGSPLGVGNRLHQQVAPAPLSQPAARVLLNLPLPLQWWCPNPLPPLTHDESD